MEPKTTQVLIDVKITVENGMYAGDIRCTMSTLDGDIHFYVAEDNLVIRNGEHFLPCHLERTNKLKTIARISLPPHVECAPPDQHHDVQCTTIFCPKQGAFRIGTH
jgi:hypothetical protein